MKNVHCVNFAIKENIFEKQTDGDKQIWIKATHQSKVRQTYMLHVFIINKKNMKMILFTKSKAIECRNFRF